MSLVLVERIRDGIRSQISKREIGQFIATYYVLLGFHEFTHFFVATKLGFSTFLVFGDLPFGLGVRRTWMGGVDDVLISLAGPIATFMLLILFRPKFWRFFFMLSLFLSLSDFRYALMALGVK